MAQRVSYHNRYDLELLELIKQISNKTRIPVSKLLDEGLQLLILKYHPVNRPLSVAKSEPVKPLLINDPNMPKDLIPISEAQKKYEVPFSTFYKWIRKGYITEYHPNVKSKAKAFLSESQLVKYLESRKSDTITGDLIPMVEACRRYDLPDTSLSNWAKKGILKTYPRPENFPGSIKGWSFISISELEKYLAMKGENQ